MQCTDCGLEIKTSESGQPCPNCGSIDRTINICDSMNIHETVIVKSRKYLSIEHIQSAAFFSRQAANIEKDCKAMNTNNARTDHSAYVIGAIFTSVSFLEAYINELFTDAAEDHHEHLKGLDLATINFLAKMWNHGIPRTARYPIIKKYELALDFSKKEPLDSSLSYYEETKYLIGLRNALIHFEPEWMLIGSSTPTEQKHLHNFEKELRNKFSINPLTGAGNPFYPDKCLGHGCAEWAVKASIKFVDEFVKKMGLQPYFDHIRTNLQTR